MVRAQQERDPFDPLAEEAATEEQAVAERQLRALEVTDFKWLMAHRQGRRFIWRLLSMTGLNSNPFRMGSPEGDVAFRCGEQNIGQRIMAEIHTLCPEHYTTMVGEHQAWVRKQQQ